MTISGVHVAIFLIATSLILFIFPTHWRRYVRVVTSERFLLTAVVAVVVLTIIGTVIVQRLPPERYAELYGEALARGIISLEFDTIFSSKFFSLALTCLGLSSLAKVLEALRRPRRLGLRGWGGLLSHLGVVVILLGGLVSAVGSFKGFMELHEGQSKSHFLQPGERATGDFALRALPFSVRLDDFSVGYYEEGRGYRLSRYERNPETGRYRFQRSWGEDALQEGVRLPEISLAVQGGQVAPNGTIMRVRQGKEEVSLVAPQNLSAERVLFNDGNVAVVLERPEPQVQEYRSNISIVDKDGQEHRVQVRVNHPGFVAGYWLHQFSYKKGDDTYTVLQIVYDPGWRIVLVGMLLLSLGIAVTCGVAIKAPHGRKEKPCAT